MITHETSHEKRRKVC